jgi:Na+:H+ antiporter, NhaA family
VLPLFALANAGVPIVPEALHGYAPLMLAVGVALVLGKPIGIVAASVLAVWVGIAEKSAKFSWAQLGGAGALAGIGFTMSLFIAGRAFASESDFVAAKMAVLGASVVAALFGVAVLWGTAHPATEHSLSTADGRTPLGGPSGRPSSAGEA